MSVFFKNDNWHIDDRLPNGKRRREKVGSSKKLAETVLAKRKGQIAEDKFLDVRKSFFTDIEKSDISNFHFHDLRHTFASQLVMVDIDLNTVKELLGHKDLTQKLQLNQLQFLPGGPLEKISPRFFLYSGVKPEFQFPLQVNTTSVN